VRRWRVPLIAFLLGGLFAALVVLGPALLFRLLRPRLEHAAGAPIRVGAMVGRLGQVVLHDLRVGEVLHARTVTLHYRAARLLLGRLALDPIDIRGATLTLGPAELERVRHRRASSGTGSPRIEIGQVRVSGSVLRYRDAALGLDIAAEFEARRAPGQPAHLHLRNLQARLAAGPSGGAAQLDLALDEAGARAELRGGRVVIWRGLQLSDIAGTIAPADDGLLALSLSGGWGDAKARLWTALGSVDPAGIRSEIRLKAERFRLDRLGPVLAHAPVRDADLAELDADLTLRQSDGGLDFEGRLDVFGLTLFHPGIGPTAVPNLDATLRTRGRFEPRARRLRLTEIVAEHEGVNLRVEGLIERLGEATPLIEARLQVAPIPCRRLLAALPGELLPVVRSFQLDGTFAADVTARVDFAALDKVDLDGQVDIDGCRVIAAPPAVDAKRLLEPFHHRVRPMPDVEATFEVGPQNPEFTPYADISPHLVNSIMTTEDSRFFDHRGFLVREFRAALARDLRERRFALGASSITMQMVKNVLLSPEKTLSRKLQELFLTWYIEQNVPKERILEIYLNVIEFGPGLYGIGRAAKHYFGKKPGELSPREAAFFSSIVPSPKRRYVHYCRGTPTAKWERYLDRILRRMRERERLSLEEYQAALATPLLFDRVEARPELDCLRFVKQVVEANQVPEDDVDSQPTSTP